MLECKSPDHLMGNHTIISVIILLLLLLVLMLIFVFVPLVVSREFSNKEGEVKMK